MKEKPKGLPSLWWQALAVEAFTQQSARPYRERQTIVDCRWVQKHERACAVPFWRHSN